jgi:NAD dependent epimerase/dehydratase family enzyme
MKVVIPGGSGQVGGILARHFQARGDSVTVVSRSPLASQWRVVTWDDAATEMEQSDVCINLAGQSVNCRYNAANRRTIYDSRVKTTRLLNDLIGSLRRPPRVWINASTATIYRHALDRPMNEITGELGGNEPGAPDTWNFSIRVAKDWEEAFFSGNTPATRKVAIRSAITLSPDRGGIFDVLLGLVRRGLGERRDRGSSSSRGFTNWISYAQSISSLSAKSFRGP